MCRIIWGGETGVSREGVPKQEFGNENQTSLPRSPRTLVTLVPKQQFGNEEERGGTRRPAPVFIRAHPCHPWLNLISPPPAPGRARSPRTPPSPPPPPTAPSAGSASASR